MAIVDTLESMVAERRRLRVAWAIVVVVALAHRATLFLLHRGQLDALIDTNASWYTFQNLPREMLGAHLLRSLLYLQQTPPASNLFMGLALKWFSWPAGCAYALIWLQTLICIAGAVVLVRVLAVLYPGRTVLWTAVGLLFLLNTDLVVLEYNSLGQTLYGPLAMLLLLVMLDRLLALRMGGRQRDAAAVGLAMGLLVLTRGTWSYFSIVCILLVTAFAPARRGRAAVACLLPIVLLQGGWAVKNWMVYGAFSLITTTWGGMHATAGMAHAGVWDEFQRYERDHVTLERGYPPWKVAAALGDPLAMAAFPQEIRNQDAAINQAMGMENPLTNTLVLRVTCAMDQQIFLEFVRANPGTMARKWLFAYRVFWQPIANYGQMFVDLFAVGNHLLDSFDLRGVVAQLGAGTLPDTQYVTSGAHGPLGPGGTFSMTPTTLYTFRWLEPFILVLNLISVHVLLPLLAVWWLAFRPPADRVDPLRMSALLVAAICYAYLAALVNLVETAENMRYRLEVEPMIWLISLICVTELTGILGRPRLPAL